MRGIHMFPLLGLAFLLAACDDDETGPTDDCVPSATKVCMTNSLFVPPNLTISSGTTITWENGDAIAHDVTNNPANPAGCPTFDLDVASDQTSSGVQFATAAVTCQYYCAIHATATTGAMRGSIIVQ